MAQQKLSYVTGNFDFQLDGVDCGMIKEIEGGNYKGEVVRLANSSGYVQNAQLTNVTIDDFKLKMAAIDGAPVQQWIDATLAMNHMYKNGAVRAKNFNQEVVAIREFTDALITEIGLPALDATSKDAAYLSLNFAAKDVKNVRGAAEKGNGKMNMKQKVLTSSHFHFTLDKLKESCRRVSKVDALVFKQKVKRDDVGAVRIHDLVPGACEIPNISITLAEVDAGPWYDWAEDFIWKGNCGQEAETSAELVYYDQAFKKELLTVQMSHVGIFNITTDKADDHSDNIRRIKVEMYMEEMKVKWGG